MTKQKLWQAVLAQIQFNISPANFATWFKGTKILDQKRETIFISVPNSFAKEWLEKKYNKLILKILHKLDSGIKEVKYVVSSNVVKTPKVSSIAKDNSPQLEFQQLKVDQETNLNPRYTFENFVVGPFNELAHAAAAAVSENPGFVYNPLFIYGGVGLGKTHLLQAIGNKISKAFPKKKIRYISSERFISGVVNSIRNHNIDEFISSFRNIDVFIVDDIQFIAGKEKTQEEFFHTFNNLYEKNKQIVISSDRLPKTIPTLEERLKSRFEGGMIADIGLPDFETRVAILEKKSQEKEVEFSKEVIEFIATNLKNNVRELEGAVNRLAIYQKINNKSPDLEVAKKLLKDLILSSVKVTNPRRIMQIVAEFYDLREKDLLKESRKKEIVKPRQIAMYLLRKELSLSFPSIGRRFGRKDHTTAIHSCRKIEETIKTNQKLSEEISLIQHRIRSG